VGTQSGKKSLQARFFAAASPAASALAGFPPAPSRKKLAHLKTFRKKMVVEKLYLSHQRVEVINRRKITFSKLTIYQLKIRRLTSQNKYLSK
jgi:hypothetical protein